MKILLTTDLYKPVINGVVTSVTNLHTELSKLGHDVRILTPKQSEPFTEDNTYYINSIGADAIYPNARILSSTGKKEVNEIIEWSPDLIHNQSEFNAYYMAKKIAKKLDIPLVHTYHTIYEDYVHYLKGNKTINKKLIQKLSGKLLDSVDHVIAPTEKVHGILSHYNVKTPMSIVPTGIDIEQFRKKVSLNRKLDLRQQYGIPENNRIMVFLGRLGKEKNVEELIVFMKEAAMNNLTFLIVGDGPYRESLEKRADMLGISKQVVFTGMVRPTEVSEYYQVADVFVSASTSETQGLTYIEALSNGLPALCREDDCLKGVVENNYNGFKYRTYDEFYVFLKRICEEDNFQEEMSKNALKQVEHFSSKQFAKSVERLYKQVLLEAERVENGLQTLSVL